jgi:hypothetical protein
VDRHGLRLIAVRVHVDAADRGGLGGIADVDDFDGLPIAAAVEHTPRHRS